MPNTSLIGCNFHYSQSIYRNIQFKGLQIAYGENPIVRQILRTVMALSFVPSTDIKSAYHDLIKPQLDTVPTAPSSLRHNMKDFFKYFESYWLRKIKEFYVFNHPVRTNNALEGILILLIVLFLLIYSSR